MPFRYSETKGQAKIYDARTGTVVLQRVGQLHRHAQDDAVLALFHATVVSLQRRTEDASRTRVSGEHNPGVGAWGEPQK
uniref:Uncharacterized protein n=1 Tax=viral metagenome TaxID=1070528 RepID=A0A6C0KCW0_9ZZZZ